MELPEKSTPVKWENAVDFATRAFASVGVPDEERPVGPGRRWSMPTCTALSPTDSRTCATTSPRSRAAKSTRKRTSAT